MLNQLYLISLILIVNTTLSLKDNQFKLSDSECVWTFNIIDNNLFISVNTNKNIIYSEFPKHYDDQKNHKDTFIDLLEIYLEEDKNTLIHFNPIIKPRLSTDKHIWYYSGKASWKNIEPIQKSFVGFIIYKECTPTNKCKNTQSFMFRYNKDWSFKKIDVSKN